MPTSEPRRLLLVSRQAQSPLRRGRVLVLMYHRVAEVSPDPWALCVSPKHSAEHLDVLQQFGDCVTAGEQLREVADAKEAPEDRIRGPVSTFSYPFGRFCDETREVVRKTGFDAACTSHYGAVLRDSDPLAIPRLQVKDCDRYTFRRKVTDAFC